jgi:hypothetical protein
VILELVLNVYCCCYCKALLLHRLIYYDLLKNFMNFG